MSRSSHQTPWTPLIGQTVVVDTDSTYVYLGTLAEIREHTLLLREADAHDKNETPSTKEQYVMDAKRFGIRPSRREVEVRLEKIVSVSRLDDVIIY